jgi:hypothetical protein
MPKFTSKERQLIDCIVANLSMKRISDAEIIVEVKKHTGKEITRQTLYNVRQRIKNDSYQWYQKLREGQYEYIHEFKERINEIIWLQQKHHEIIEKNSNNSQIQQTSLAELHRLNITLSNYFDVAPTIVSINKGTRMDNDKYTISATQQDKEIIV